MARVNFIQSRAEQLAQHLRDLIVRREVTSPLPGIRAWSRSLGVGHGTLELALRILRRDGVVRVQARKGIQIAYSPTAAPPSQRVRVVRWIYFGRDHTNLSAYSDLLLPIMRQLHAHGIHTSVETCNTIRLKAIRRQGARAHELLILPSFSRKHQEMFSALRKNALLIGPPFEGIPLPFITNDVWPSVRHAVHSLAQRGIPGVTLVIKQSGRQSSEEYFLQICRESPQPIRGDVVRLPDEVYEQSQAAARLAKRIRPPHAIIALYNIPASLLITSLMRVGLRVPEQVEVVGMNTTTEAIRTHPVPPHYPFPVEAFTRAVCQAALHYFEMGELPPLRKLIPLKLAVPST